MKCGRNREIRRNKQGNWEFVEYSTNSGRVLKVLIGKVHTHHYSPYGKYAGQTFTTGMIVDSLAMMQVMVNEYNRLEREKGKAL